MATTIEQLDGKIKRAASSMNELRSMFSKTESTILELDEVIKGHNNRLSQMIARQEKLAATMATAIAGEDKRKVATSYDRLTPQIESQKAKIAELEQLQKALSLPPGIAAAVKTIQTTTTNYDALISRLKLLDELQSKGLGNEHTASAIASTIKELKGQATAADLAASKIRKYTADLQNADQAARSLGGAAALPEGRLFPAVTVGSSDKVAKAEKARIEKEQELARLRSKYESEAVYTRARAAASGYGFGPENLTKSLQTPVTGVERLTFSQREVDAAGNFTGKLKEMQLYIDKMGNILPNTSRQFNTFTSAVARDVVELTKWTIAIGIIYGPLRKFQEMLDKMIQNEALLANAMVVMVDSTTKAGQVFDVVSTAANTMGEDVGGAIDVFTQAYRATGDLGDQYSRIALATQLMTDGMTLAKLSGMAYNEAIDSLVGSLKQAGIPLNEGRTLLDKWVRTSQIANVDVSTLATGFSVLGESASAAGLSVDQLNGLLAVISENMGTSGREAANAARAIVSGFESTKAIKAMNLLGISVNDIEGEARPLLEIMTQIQNMRLQGLISDTQYADLTLAIGGGTRRQAVVAATIEDTSKINQVAAQSADAHGAAEAALGKKLDTVQTAAIRLNNTFQSLAQTLGDEGGVLDLFKFVLELVNGMVKAIDSLSGAIGKVAPLLAGTLLAKGLFSMKPDIFASAMGGLGNLGNKVFGNVPGGGRYSSETGEIAPIGRGTAWSMRMQAMPKGLGFGDIGTTLKQGLGAGLVTSLLPAIMNLSAGDTKRAAADIGGGIVGAIVGTMTGVGPIIGSVIGQAIAEAFVSATETSMDIASYRWATPKETGPSPTIDPLKLQENIIAGLYEGKSKIGLNIAGAIVEFVGGILEPKRGFTKGQVVYERAAPEAREEFDRQLALLRAQGKLAQEAGVPTYFQEQQAKTAAGVGTYATTLRKARGLELGEELNLAKIRPTEYATMMTQIRNFETVASGWETSLGAMFRAQNEGILTVSDSYSRYIDIMTYGSAEQIESVNAVSNEIGQLMNTLEALRNMPPLDVITEEVDGQAITQSVDKWMTYYKTKLGEVQEYGTNLLTGISVSAQLQKQPVPSLFNQGQTIISDLNSVRAWLTQAASQNVQYIKQSTVSGERPGGYTQEEIDAVRASYENVAVGIEEGGQLVYRSLLQLLEYLQLPQELIGTDWLKKVLDEMIAKGQIIVKVETKEPGLEQPGIPRSMEGFLKSWIEYYETMMRSYGITAEEGPMVVIWEDGQWSTMQANEKAFNMALQKIQELEQKQLEQGMWNIPEGATMWVPITSLTPANQPQKPSGWDLENPPAPEYGPYGPLGPQPEVPPEVDTGGTAENPYYVIPISRELAGGLKMGGSPAEKWETDWKFRMKNEQPIGVTPAMRKSPETMEKVKESTFWERLLGPLRGVPWGESAPTRGEPIGGMSGILGGIQNALMGLNVTLRSMNLAAGIGRGATMGRDNATTPGTTKTSLNLNTTTTLTVDGRVLARSIKPYLIADINRAVAALGRGNTTRA